ncbi:hypothetical protein IPA_07080 [Ignicoccus pacificus DSM 13166]|uniref:Uncharacterized protein n=1 Tax=Ignicoccus pacificus DSM 13166 TaxID=940294 RepID=A0A977KD00_9CREN|nr:hypothetical protein IPA_07080 [Ignicoccus pacificus DSM 13166]
MECAGWYVALSTLVSVSLSTVLFYFVLSLGINDLVQAFLIASISGFIASLVVYFITLLIEKCVCNCA